VRALNFAHVKPSALLAPLLASYDCYANGIVTPSPYRKHAIVLCSYDASVFNSVTDHR
jgi:hypothetical protein